MGGSSPAPFAPRVAKPAKFPYWMATLWVWDINTAQLIFKVADTRSPYSK